MMFGRGITVLENTADGVRESAWSFADMDYVEQGAVHLYSWLRLNGVVADRPAAVQVEYNAVVASLFTQVVRAVRQAWTGPDSAVLTEEQGKLASLVAVDYKLGNYARESILPGERVLATVHQPEITVPGFLFFRRRLTATYVCVLTDRELIFISDDGSGGDTGRYGVVRRYIPLTKIKDWQLASVACDKTGVWRLQLPGETVVLHFSVPAQSALLVLTVLLDEARGRGKGKGLT
ncbi:hypothetical protein [Propionispora sp. 2/2-37]|uniref:hypothetical protein n=1 Tax=Propionispora sp. 2/2-37 TaxID=1677858 RepID=UPI0012E0FE90|nr:hypothetical protein [Propionispora sp. 2/2-37]